MKARYLTVIALLLLTAVIIKFLSYDIFNKPEQGIKAIAQIPEQIGQWHGKDMPLAEQVYDILETRSIINRAYSSPSGRNVFLSLVYYTETKVDFHAPESCLGGRGIRVSKEEKDIIVHQDGKDIPMRVNQLLRKGEGDEPDTLIWYFYKAGDFLGENYIKLRFHLALNRFTKEDKSGALIRISAPIAPGQNGEDKADESLRNFIDVLYPYLLLL